MTTARGEAETAPPAVDDGKVDGWVWMCGDVGMRMRAAKCQNRCGRVITRPRPNQRFCGERCKNALWRKQHPRRPAPRRRVSRMARLTAEERAMCTFVPL
jgi:hypothetical protein